MGTRPKTSGTREYGGLKRWIWRRIQSGIDEEPLEVRAVEVTASSVGDAPVRPSHRRQRTGQWVLSDEFELVSARSVRLSLMPL
jgi:hypothetical protein